MELEEERKREMNSEGSSYYSSDEEPSDRESQGEHV